MAGMFRAGRSMLRSVAGRFQHQPQRMSTPRVLMPISFQADRCITTKGPFLSARKDLLKCIDEEIRMENVPALPHIGDFETKVSGCLATLRKTLDNGNEVEIQLDANSSVEVMSSLVEEESDNDEVPSYVPMFTVDIKKTEGSILRFDCTFDLDDVVEEVEVDQSFRIQSVSVIPKHASGNSDSVYAADASNLDEGLSQALKDYLREQGVTPDMLADLLEFYSAFEQQCYIDEFLKGIRAFLDSNN